MRQIANPVLSPPSPYMQLLTIRTVHEQLARLLPTTDQEALTLSAAFTPFAGLQPLLHNPYTEPLWGAAVAQYERGMSPAENRIASVLRSRMEKLEAQPNQLLREFQKFKELIRRPTIGKELLSQRWGWFDCSVKVGMLWICMDKSY